MSDRIQRARSRALRHVRTGKRWAFRRLDATPILGGSGRFALANARTARRARNVGDLTLSVTLAQRRLGHRPDDEEAREILAASADELALLGHPLPLTLGAADVTHETRAGSVVYLAHNTRPWNNGGYATRTHGIVTGLAQLGWDVAVASRYGYPYDRWDPDDPRVAPADDVVDEMTYHRLLDPGSRRYPAHPFEAYTERFATRLEDYARRRGAVLLHSGGFYPLGHAAERAARRLGVPVVYEVRGLEYLGRASQRPSFEGTERYRYLVQQEVEAVCRVDRAFVITRAIREELERHGVPQGHMRVLPNGVHAEDFRPVDRDSDLEAQLGVRDKVVIGYIGSLIYYEGIDLLLRAAARLKSRRRDFHVLIVGDGTNMATLKDLDVELGTSDVVTFTGRVPHHDVNAYYSLLDVSTIPRLPLPICELVSPMKPFEAMAMEKAMLVSDVAALTEIVEDEVTGLTFRKGDVDSYVAQLERLIGDTTLRARLGSQARSWVLKERDWSAIVRTVDETYRELLDEAGVPPAAGYGEVGPTTGTRQA
ncbi:MAG TPA: glycosyltransferase family 4 protein [Actinomycetes bacterium]|nr:glycosyltransferase family 4 protein [Actinomycetes bacterium]